MNLWVDLLFGNWIGLLSLITVFGSIAVVAYLGVMLTRNAAKGPKARA
jgi:hypothetical protein